MSASSSKPVRDELPDAVMRFKYYMFDWDDNVLHMPTRIYLERRVDDRWEPWSVTTAEFAALRDRDVDVRPEGGDWDHAFRDFDDHDAETDTPFLDDTRRALELVQAGGGGEAPSFDTFRKALVDGHLFAIITARAHRSEAIRQAVECFIETVLTPDEKGEMILNLRRFLLHFEGDADRLADDELVAYYLDFCRYWGVSSEEFRSLAGLSTSRADSPEIGKREAIRRFVVHAVGLVQARGHHAPVSVGFSDDDPGNLEAAESFLREELARLFPSVKFVVYDTSDADLPSGRKIVIREAE